MLKIIRIFLLYLFFANINQVHAEDILAQVSLDEAAKKIIEGNGLKVLGAKTEIIDGKEVHVIKVLTDDGRIQKQKVDAQTGKILLPVGKN
jgi:uncharacterized membrane protein YkoI